MLAQIVRSRLLLQSSRTHFVKCVVRIWQDVNTIVPTMMSSAGLHLGAPPSPVSTGA